jgi:hypothetical protein
MLRISTSWEITPEGVRNNSRWLTWRDDTRRAVCLPEARCISACIFVNPGAATVFFIQNFGFFLLREDGKRIMVVREFSDSRLRWKAVRLALLTWPSKKPFSGLSVQPPIAGGSAKSATSEVVMSPRVPGTGPGICGRVVSRSNRRPGHLIPMSEGGHNDNQTINSPAAPGHFPRLG